MDHTANHLLSLQEAAARGYAGYSTLRKYIAEGRLPAVKVGSRIKVQQSDLDALIEPISQTPRTFDDVESAVSQVVAEAPPLTTAQREQLAVLVGNTPARRAPADDSILSLSGGGGAV